MLEQNITLRLRLVMHMIEVRTDYLSTSASDNKLDMRMKMKSLMGKKF